MPKPKNNPKKELKPVLHIYCEGEKTEPNYLKGYIDKFFSENRRLKVVKIEPTKKNTPKELVEEAISAKGKNPDGDIFWVIYDRESEQKYPHSLHATAYDKAGNKGIFVALSNVCFEVWLLLHFQETTKPYNNYDDLKKNSPLHDEFKERGFNNYNKGNKGIFNIFKEDEIKQARIRAERMNRQTKKTSADPLNERPYQWNPYTDVHKLLDEIDKFASPKNS